MWWLDMTSVNDYSETKHDSGLLLPAHIGSTENIGVLNVAQEPIKFDKLTGVYKLNHIDAIEADRLMGLSGEWLRRYAKRLNDIRTLFYYINTMSDELYGFLGILIESITCRTKSVDIYKFQLIAKYDVGVADINDNKLMKEIELLINRIFGSGLSESTFFELPFFLENIDEAKKVQKIIFLLRYWYVRNTEYGFIFMCESDHAENPQFVMETMLPFSREYLKYYMSSLSGDGMAIMQFECPHDNTTNHDYSETVLWVLFWEQLSDEVGFCAWIVDNFAFYRSSNYFWSLTAHDEEDIRELDQRIPIIEDLMLIPHEIWGRIDMNPFSPLIYRFIIKYRSCFFTFNDGELVMNINNKIFKQLKAIFWINMKKMKELIQKSIQTAELYAKKARSIDKINHITVTNWQDIPRAAPPIIRKKLTASLQGKILSSELTGEYELTFIPALPDGTSTKKLMLTQGESYNLQDTWMDRYEKYSVKCRYLSESNYETLTFKIDSQEWTFLASWADISHKFRETFLSQWRIAAERLIKNWNFEWLHLFISQDGINWTSYDRNDVVDFSLFPEEWFYITLSPAWHIPHEKAKIVRERFVKNTHKVQEEIPRRVFTSLAAIPPASPKRDTHAPIETAPSLEDIVLDIFAQWEADVKDPELPKSLTLEGANTIYTVTLDGRSYIISMNIYTGIIEAKWEHTAATNAFIDLVTKVALIEQAHRWIEISKLKQSASIITRCEEVKWYLKSCLSGGILQELWEDPKIYSEHLRRYFLDDNRFCGSVLKKWETDQHVYLQGLINHLESNHGMNIKIYPATVPVGTRHIELSFSLSWVSGVWGKIATSSVSPFHTGITYYFDTNKYPHLKALEPHLKEILQYTLLLLGQLGKRVIGIPEKWIKQEQDAQLGYKSAPLTDEDILELLAWKKIRARYTRVSTRWWGNLLDQAEKRFNEGRWKVRTGMNIDADTGYYVHEIHSRRSNDDFSGVDAIVLKDESFSVSHMPGKNAKSDEKTFALVGKYPRHKKYFLRRLKAHITGEDKEQSGFENGAWRLINEFVKSLWDDVVTLFLRAISVKAENALLITTHDGTLLIDAFLKFMKENNIEIIYRSPTLIPVDAYMSLVQEPALMTVGK
jgi:hypothetical protein